MFEYEIYYRLDDHEYFTTEIRKIKADSIEELHNEIKSIERNHTIISITNLNFE